MRISSSTSLGGRYGVKKAIYVYRVHDQQEKERLACLNLPEVEPPPPPPLIGTIETPPHPFQGTRQFIRDNLFLAHEVLYGTVYAIFTRCASVCCVCMPVRLCALSPCPCIVCLRCVLTSEVAQSEWWHDFYLFLPNSQICVPTKCTIRSRQVKEISCAHHKC